MPLMLRRPRYPIHIIHPTSIPWKVTSAAWNVQEITLFGNLVSVTVGECLMDLYHQKWKSLVLNKHVARSFFFQAKTHYLIHLLATKNQSTKENLAETHLKKLMNFRKFRIGMLFCFTLLFQLTSGPSISEFQQGMSFRPSKGCVV